VSSVDGTVIIIERVRFIASGLRIVLVEKLDGSIGVDEVPPVFPICFSSHTLPDDQRKRTKDKGQMTNFTTGQCNFILEPFLVPGV
jgi:hypothetical protein